MGDVDADFHHRSGSTGVTFSVSRLPHPRQLAAQVRQSDRVCRPGVRCVVRPSTCELPRGAGHSFVCWKSVGSRV
jgi:hypothetical protein